MMTLEYDILRPSVCPPHFYVSVHAAYGRSSLTNEKDHDYFLDKVLLSCASFKTVCMLCIPAFFMTFVSGILSCHLILTAFSNSLSGNGEVSLHDIGTLSRSHMHTRGLVVPQPGVKLYQAV